MKQGKLFTTGIIVFFVIVGIIIFSNATFLTIGAGERGVLFKTFSGGLEKDNIYTPGFHVIAPWNTMYVYDVREQTLESIDGAGKVTGDSGEQMEVLSSNGLTIKVDVSFRFHPMYDKIGNLHEKFGIGYKESLVRPEVRSSVREAIGRFTPEELYSTRRNEVQAIIQSDLEKTLNDNYIVLTAVLIRDITLPDRVKTAIEDKLEAEQSAKKYEFILLQERQESERKIIEAEAKAKSNQILNASLSDKILQDKGIEATLELAKSPNTKIVIVGGKGDGLPLILNN